MRYAVLGSLKVWDDAGIDVPVPAGKQSSVLAALLLRPGQVVGFDALVGALWADRPVAGARSGLATYVSRLRAVLGPDGGSRVRHEGRGYLFAPEPGDEIDHVRAADLECRARAAAVEGRWSQAREASSTALGLWRGEALADVESDELRCEYLPYLDELRIRLEQLRIDAHLACGDFDAILPALRVVSGTHPLNEPFHERHFVALYGAGRHADAQEWYRQVRLRLREEIGSEPSPLLRRFYEQTLRGAGVGAMVDELLGPRFLTRPAAAVSELPMPGALAAVREAETFSTDPPYPDLLPPPPRRFVGRDSELISLTEAMRGNHPPELPGLTLLVGMAGVGKSALALTWAHRSASEYPDGRIYVDLKGFADRGAPLTVDEAVRTLLDCFGVPEHRMPATAAGRVALYRAVIADKRVLIVLDNVGHSDQVRPLLPPAGPAQLLVTSRSALASLVTIDFAKAVNLEPLSARESRDLLNLRLGAERTSGHEEALAAIAEHCAHLPLALVVAAGRARVRPQTPLAELAAQLGEIGSSLGTLDGGDAAVNVRTVLSWSYRQLSPEAARLYRLLALHPGPDLSTAAAASLAGLPLADAQATLAELVSMNMAAVDAGGRYGRHGLLEAFATERLAAEEDEGERDAAYRRLVDHYLRAAVSASVYGSTVALPSPAELPPARPGTVFTPITDTAGGVAWFDSEREVLSVLVPAVAAAGLDAELWQLACALSTGLARMGRLQEDVANARLALEAARRLADPVAEAHVHRMFGRDLPRLGDPEGGLRHLGRALELYCAAGHMEGIAETKRTVANVRVVQGDLAAAVPLLQEYLAHAEAADDRHGQAMALNALGWSYAHLGRLPEALASCRKALKLKVATGRLDHIGMLWDSLALVHHRLGDLDEAQTCYHRAIEACLAEGDTTQAALSSMRLGDALRDRGDHATARRNWREALAVFEAARRPEAALVRERLAAIPRQRAGVESGSR
ncbi:BTAD domain-containing putative transcriptional regulator [Catenulispora sp. GP43]|uniref:AfsR/SARP family transcriptional regulator n=1 Tax=Catenulispora sp. GP43 TaxID=3156263 RepID=UPI003511FB32